MKKQHKAQWFIFVLGIVCILIAIILSKTMANEDSLNLNVIFLSVGCSIISVVIINYVEYTVTLPETNVINIINNWKLVAVFKTRQEMNTVTNKLLMNANELDIAAFGCKGFINFQGENLKARLKKGLKIRFLVPNKDSGFIVQREIDEGAVAGDIRNGIGELISWIKKTKRELKLTDDKIMIKSYSSLPIDSIMRIDDYLFTGPFMINKISQLTMSYQYKNGGEGYDYFNSYFNSIWDNDEISSLITTSIESSS